MCVCVSAVRSVCVCVCAGFNPGATSRGDMPLPPLETLTMNITIKQCSVSVH